MILYNIMIWALIAAAITTIVVQIANAILIRNRIRKMDYNLKKRIGLTEKKGFIARDDRTFEIWLYRTRPKKGLMGDWMCNEFNADYPLQLPEEIVPNQYPDCEPRRVTVRFEVLTEED